ncbi:MAG TPA: DUF3471 domain-containing protein [Gemmatimonadaceae bacterium]|nr:DUF3471 domain-containing protein [Gemmatimonadaceae bacterium]
MRLLRLAAFVLLCSATHLSSQSAPTTFLTTAGKDTFCFEQYSRKGNVVSGTWVVMHSPGVFVHDYTITLSNDGLPTHYTMKYTTPGDPNPPQLDSVDVVYGRDSATIVFILKDSSVTHRVAMRDAFPLLGQSFVGVELALLRLRRMHIDSANVTLHPPTQPSSPITIAPTRFVGSDTAVLGPIRMHVSGDARILELHNGALDMRRVAPIDVHALTDGFVKKFAARRVALAAAAAARVEVALTEAQLDRFVGDYKVGAVTATITRDGDHLAFALQQGQQQQPPFKLLASSSTEFFVRKPDLVITFETDANGAVTSLAIGVGDTRQRLPRVKPPSE